MGATSDDEFCCHHRNSEEDDTGEVDQDEGSAAVLSCFDRKAPDVA